MLDNELEQLPEHTSDLGPRLQTELDEIVAADREVAQPVRARQLMLEERADVFEIARVTVLSAQVGEAHGDDVERELVAVLQEEAPRLHRRLRPVLCEVRVLAHDR